jgi:hypothetical protein
MIKSGIIVLLILLSAFLFISKKQRNIVSVKSDTITVVKTNTFDRYIKGDKIPFKVIDTIYKTKYDTAFILQDYNVAKEVTDSIRQDSNLFVIKDTISNNRIIGRSFKAEIQEKTVTITNTVESKPKAALYIGIRSDISHDYTKINHNITLSFKTRQKGLFNIGYGMSGYSVGYSLKL